MRINWKLIETIQSFKDKDCLECPLNYCICFSICSRSMHSIKEFFGVVTTDSQPVSQTEDENIIRRVEGEV